MKQVGIAYYLLDRSNRILRHPGRNDASCDFTDQLSGYAMCIQKINGMLHTYTFMIFCLAGTIACIMKPGGYIQRQLVFFGQLYIFRYLFTGGHHFPGVLKRMKCNRFANPGRNKVGSKVLGIFQKSSLIFHRVIQITFNKFNKN